jgi:hypothetical protein
VVRKRKPAYHSYISTILPPSLSHLQGKEQSRRVVADAGRPDQVLGQGRVHEGEAPSDDEDDGNVEREGRRSSQGPEQLPGGGGEGLVGRGRARAGRRGGREAEGPLSSWASGGAVFGHGGC